MSPTVARFVRFLFVGGIGTAVYLIAVVAVVELFDWDPRIGNFVGFVVAFPVSYLGHYHISFASAHAHQGTFARFVVITAMCYLTSQAIMNLSVGSLEVSYLTALFFIVMVQPLVSFSLNKVLVFRRGEPLVERNG